MRAIRLAVAWVVVLVGTQGDAGVVVLDNSPATIGAAVTPVPSINGSAWTNLSGSQNFAESIVFSVDTLLEGMDVYTVPGRVNLGDTATIRFREDLLGSPGSLLTEFSESVSMIDFDGTVNILGGIVRVHVDFSTPFMLLGGTQYWIGMSGSSTEFGQLALNTVPHASMAQFNGTVFEGMSETGDMAFRLEGNAASSAVPEPTSVALCGIAALGMMFLGFRRRQPPVTAI